MTKREMLAAMIRSLRVMNVNRLDRRKNPRYDSRAASPLVTALQKAGISHIDSVKSRRPPESFVPGWTEE